MWANRGTREYELDDIMLLKVGRHIRPNENFKLIIGREEGENNYLEGYKHQFTYLRSSSHLGPLALFDSKEKEISAEDLYTAARAVARFTDGQFSDKVTMEIKMPVEEESRILEVKPFTSEEILEEWYV